MLLELMYITFFLKCFPLQSTSHKLALLMSLQIDFKNKIEGGFVQTYIVHKQLKSEPYYFYSIMQYKAIYYMSDIIKLFYLMTVRIRVLRH